ncbi:MAG: flagellar motor rotation protein MotB [Flavipsychrobacter sp.]|jgi:chemotaxis protein MotB|nr:flagellar motor rotation protein MotB [Flavipsychrobacter sp.]
MQLKQFLVLGVSSLMVVSCTTTKKLKKCAEANNRIDSAYKALQGDYSFCKEQHAVDATKIQSLEAQLADAKANNNQLLNQMKDLSIISGSQAESIKKSLDNIGVKDAYISELQKAITRKDSMNMALVINLKSAIGNLNDKDINIKVDKGVVYVDISDKMLFKSGSWEVTDQASEILGKVAMVLNSQPDVEFMVEGHTDNVKFKKGDLEDNWDLSTKRATSIVRILQNKYHVPPSHMTAAGRGEYLPIAGNETADGKATNRRTRIVILPQLDQFFKILEKPKN